MKKQRNILHLEASPGWGGQEIRILHEAQQMRLRGHTVVFCVMKGGRLILEACKAGFTAYPIRFQKRYWGISLLKLLLLIRRHRIDLINTHSSLDAWLGGIAARLSRRFVVRTRHLSTPIKSGWNSRILYGLLADFVVTTCSSVIPMICQQSGKRVSECRSIPTGIDPDAIANSLNFSMDLRSSLRLEKDDFLVGTVCFMRSWKGLEEFIQAANLLRDISQLKWVVIGGGHAEKYQQLVDELHLQKVVYFTGYLQNPFSAMNSLDVFALLSTAHEGVSQAILQAAYLGKPLIATNTGGLGEVCKNGITGIQVQTFSSQQTAQAVLQLKNDPYLCKRLGANASRLVNKCFTLKQTIDQMEWVYRRCWKI